MAIWTETYGYEPKFLLSGDYSLNMKCSVKKDYILNCETGLFIPFKILPYKDNKKKFQIDKKGTKCVNTEVASFCNNECFSFWVPIAFNGNKDKVIWGMMETILNVTHQPQWKRLLWLFWKATGPNVHIIWSSNPIGRTI